MAQYKDKIIGFVDILGWKNLVERSEKNLGVTLNDLLSYIKAFTTSKTAAGTNNYEHTICPDSKKVNDNLDFQKTQVSDCVILSSEKSPAGVIALLKECNAISYNLLCHGIMCRGYITVGKMLHTEGNTVIGTGYQHALAMEKEFGLPFIGIDSKVNEFIEKHTDRCVQKTYSNLILKDADFISLFPFRDLSGSFIIGSFMGIPFDANKYRDSNQKTRIFIEKAITLLIKHTDIKKDKAVAKTKIYIKELIKELLGCQETDQLLDQLNKEFETKSKL
ncbi:hypothetical protein [Desulfobacula toluolica]|uniref:Uncharacterized protein n=1 Tax=Desulfobacula toluolica (strain DSM 7467 / Tol2) TaxID=651182 RepID=K0NMJ3_DESTT|nr:hypothetical protein [Desulfobacula toluolica]CCK81258.1 uncharacterized protein TOL2_C31010 [Desulfobacula toluolica Tol2]